MWPARSVGLDRGRSLINARPTPTENDAQRLELWAYVQQRFAAEQPAARALSGGGSDGF